MKAEEMVAHIKYVIIKNLYTIEYQAKENIDNHFSNIKYIHYIYIIRNIYENL